jgi:enoyl-CoA hydratase/carnithine racemase
MSDHVTFTVEDGVATLRLARPEKKNALTLAMYARMAEHLEAAGREPTLRCVLIAGAPGVFCAGNDIEDFMRFAGQGSGLGAPILRFLKALVACERPLVAAVDGPAVGVGTTMLLHCDHILCSERATFATPFIDLGLVPEAASSLVGPMRFGHPRAFELLVMGRRWDAAKALAVGLVNAVVPDVEAAGLAAAREIAAKAPQALALSRKLLRGDPAAILARIDEEAAHFEARLQTPEAMQAFMAFMTRRKA